MLNVEVQLFGFPHKLILFRIIWLIHIQDILLSFLPLLIFRLYEKDICPCGHFIQYHLCNIISYFSLLFTNSLNPQGRQVSGLWLDQFPIHLNHFTTNLFLLKSKQLSSLKNKNTGGKRKRENTKLSKNIKQKYYCNVLF